MDANFETIKKAVLKNRGGLAGMSDSQILTLWKLLPDNVQQEYLESVQAIAPAKKKKEAKDAAGDKS